MHRTARIVNPDAPHHATQRGNNCQDIFWGADNRLVCWMAMLSNPPRKPTKTKPTQSTRPNPYKPQLSFSLSALATDYLYLIKHNTRINGINRQRMLAGGQVSNGKLKWYMIVKRAKPTNGMAVDSCFA